MLIVNQMRTEALNARDLNKIVIEDVQSGGIQLQAIVAYTWESEGKIILGTYDSSPEASDALTDLALAWESVKCYFMS